MDPINRLLSPVFLIFTLFAPFALANEFCEPLMRLPIIRSIEVAAPRKMDVTGQRIREIPQALANEMTSRLSSVQNAIGNTNDVVVALNYSGKKEKIQMVTSGLSIAQNEVLLEEFQKRGIFEQLQLLPPKLRLKYFRIVIPTTGSVGIDFVFAWQTGINFRSHLTTGFGEIQTEFITPFVPAEKAEGVAVREDLMADSESQETGATCGPAALCRVFRSRRLATNEWQILELANRVKPEAEIIAGNDPGFSMDLLDQVLKLPEGLDLSDFKITAVKVKDETGLKTFRNLVKRASTRANHLDIVVNLWSPVIGREGAGHFLPVAGYNPITDQVLMSETNLALNPSYWVSLPLLYQAMMSEKHERGYFKIETR